MFDRFVRWLASEPAWAFPEPIEQEIWAHVIQVGGDNGPVRVIFPTEPRLLHDPVFLSRLFFRMVNQAREASAEPTPEEQVVLDYVTGNLSADLPQMWKVPSYVSGEVPTFMADAAVPDGVSVQRCIAGDLNTDFLQVRYNGVSRLGTLRLEIVGNIPAENVIRRRWEVLKANHAVVVNACLIQANAELYQPGPEDLPALVLFTLDRSVSVDSLERLAAQIGELKYRELAEPDLIEAAKGPQASDAGWSYHRRFRVPAKLTGGAVVYAGDLWVRRPFLPNGYFKGDGPHVLPCLAEPGDEGGLEQLPCNRT
jgi:hypothetical protein